MNILDNFSQKTLIKNQENVDKGKEEFDILSVTTSNNKFNITIQNTGNLPINFTRLWVQNKTATDWISKYDISNSVSPGYAIKNIGQNVKLTALPTKEYSLKLVTGRGNVKELYVNSASLHPLDLKLYLLPNMVASKFTTTVMFTVTNNMTSNAILTNLQPNLDISALGASAEMQSGPSPGAYPVLERGETAIFTWTYKITGNPGEKTEFTASLVNGYPGQSINAEVQVNSVALADQSQTSVTSAGLSSLTTSDNQLIFHKETSDALDGYQMQSVAPDSSTGLVIQLDTTNPSFYTLNDTSSITLPNGTWNAYLRYLSSPVPTSIINNLPNMIFHFEDGSTATTAKDSTTNNDMALGSGNNKPVWYATNGPNATGVFHFSSSSNQYMSHSITSSVNDIRSPASTAGWFKTDPNSPSRMVILRMGDQGDNQKFYEVGLTSGNMLFRFSSKSGLIDGSCQTSGTNYADGNWHHFAALRTGTSTCQIYADGILKATDSDNSCPGSGSCSSTITPPGTWNIGRDPSSSGTNPFNGYLDDIIHWNNYQLTSSQITDMYKTTFGSLSHKITFTIDTVDQNGNSPQNIVTNSSYAMPFKDSFGASWTSPPDSAWAYANYTTKVPTFTISSNERLKFKMTYVHPTNGELSMKLKIDATGVTSDKGNSFLQTTSPSSPFSAYYIFDSGTSSGTVNIYNSGPHNAFISFLSRITYTSLDGSLSYGAVINKINSTSISSSQDSPLIKTAHIQTATYAKPTDIPGSPSGNNITPGKYRMYVFLSGYDDTGTIFLKTIYVGVVRVI